MGQTCPLVRPQNLIDLSEMAFVQHICDSQKWAWSTTSFGSNPAWRTSRVPLTKIKHEDYQLAVSAENRVPSQKEKKSIQKGHLQPILYVLDGDTCFTVNSTLVLPNYMLQH